MTDTDTTTNARPATSTGPQEPMPQEPLPAPADRTEAGPDSPPEDPRAAARAMWLAEPSLTGDELGDRFGMKGRWGRKQIAAAKAARNGTPSGTNGTADTGSRSDGTAAQQRPGRAGTPSTARRSGNGTTPTARTAQPRRSGTARPAPGTVPFPLLATTVLAVGVVTVVCAIVSYSHIRDLAVIAGMGSLASWLPLGVDGLVVASSCSVIVDRHLERHGQPLAWAGVVLGLAGSLAANVLAVDPDLVSLRAVRWVLAGYTPAALAVSGHLLFRMLGEHRTPPSSLSSSPSRERR